MDVLPKLILIVYGRCGHADRLRVYVYVRLSSCTAKLSIKTLSIQCRLKNRIIAYALCERIFVHVSCSAHVDLGILCSTVVATANPDDNSCNLWRSTSEVVTNQPCIVLTCTKLLPWPNQQGHSLSTMSICRTTADFPKANGIITTPLRIHGTEDWLLHGIQQI